MYELVVLNRVIKGMKLLQHHRNLQCRCLYLHGPLLQYLTIDYPLLAVYGTL